MYSNKSEKSEYQNEAYLEANNYLSFIKQNNFDFEKAYLFGSNAKGNFTCDSDIDIAIVFNNLQDRFYTQVQLLKLTTKFDTRIEPHPIDKKEFNNRNPFVHEILKYGIEMNFVTD